MKNNYWQFILGLQHNAQRYFENQIALYEIQHDWCLKINDVFFVRNMQNNELLYDSINHLVVDMQEQGILHCKLIPFELLFPDLILDSKFYNFEQSNYPLAVFIGENHSEALVNISNEKTKTYSGEFLELNGSFSTQLSQEYLLFSLVKLDQKQIQRIRSFSRPPDWPHYYQHLKKELLESSFNFKRDLSLTLKNNLILKDTDDGYNLLKSTQAEANLAFSLIDKLIGLQNLIESEETMSWDGRSAFSDFIYHNNDEMQLFKDQLDNEFITLVSQTANNYQSAFIENSASKNILYLEQTQDIQTIKQLPTIDTNNTSDILDQKELNNEETSAWKSVAFLIMFITAIVLICYGILWLSIRFAFANFSLWALFIVVVLIILTRK